jgi:putative ABC transport system permease protein
MGFVSSLGRDLKFAFRQLRQTPIVSAVALLSLALGIGANVAIFSLVNALILKALPIHEPERLVQIQLIDLPQAADASLMPVSNTTSFTYPQWEYLRDHQDFFAGVTAVGYARFNLNASGEARPIPGLYVSGRFLDTLGVTPIIGRGFTVDDDRRGGDAVAIISHGFWQREFGGGRAVLGRTVNLDGNAFTIIGVTPPEFFGVRVGFTFDVMIPLGNEPIIRGVESALDRRSTWWLSLFGRLMPGETMAQAQARLQALHGELRAATMPPDYRPEDKDRYFADPFGLTEAATGISNLRDRYSRPLYVLLVIVGLVLTIACANMANLLLAQSMARRRELAVRLSLGARRPQLIRQLLVESVMLSGAGALAGLAIAAWGSRALIAIMSTRTNVIALDLSMDWRVFAFTAVVGVLTGLLFGVVPAMRGTALSPADTLRDHARGIVSGGGRLNIGHGLVALQVALSFVLVFGSTLFVRTLVTLTTQGMGFEAERVLLATVDLRRTGAAADARLALFEQTRDAVAAVPGIEAAAVSFVTPVSGSTWNLRISVPGYEGSERDRSSLYNGVTHDYFKALGTPLLTGRDFSPADRAGSPEVAIVTEAFAKKYFAAQNPIGKTFVLEGFGPDRKDRQLEIVGLVADAKYRTLREEPQPTIYAPMAQAQQISSSVRMVIKTLGEPWQSREAILAAIGGVNKQIAIDFRTLEEDLGAAVLQERLIASLSAFFGGLALLLAALGLYGVMSYSVSLRRNEIGVRMALGAEPSRVVSLVLRHVAMITVVGLIVGAAAAVGTGRFINSLLFNLAATDRTMIMVTAITLAAAAALAGYLPARRAARIDPMSALREE